MLGHPKRQSAKLIKEYKFCNTVSEVGFIKQDKAKNYQLLQNSR